MTRFVRNYGELVYRGFLFTLTSLIFIANLWLCQNFTSRSEFESLKSGVFDVQKSLVRMEGINSVLLDHETRIRVLEHTFTTRDMMKQTSYFDWLSQNEQKVTSIERESKNKKEN